MREDIIYEADLPVNAKLMTISSYPIHMHSDVQIVFVLEGEIDLTLTYETYKLKKNDLHYIHSEDLHSAASRCDNNLVVVLSIDMDYLERIYPKIRTTVFTMTTDKSLMLYGSQQMELKACLFLILSELLQKREGYCGRIGEITKALFELLHKDFRGFTVDQKSKAFVHKRLQDVRQTQRICDMISDIYTNYAEPSTLEEIAARQHLNLYYLSHLFSQTVGLNYRSFVNMVRVETSEYDLLASDLSISHIALSSGFSNTRYYRKHFAFWFGMAPEEFRKRYVANTITRKRPDVILYGLCEYEALIHANLKTITAACANFTVTLANQIIPLDKVSFDADAKIRLNLTCCNPDLLSVDDSYFKEKQILRPEFISKRFRTVKIMIEEPPEQEEPQDADKLFDSIEKALSVLTHHLTCNFSLGFNKSNDMLFTKSGVKTPLYYILEFLAIEYDGLHASSNYIVLKNGIDYHILCWNLHLSQTKDITVKCKSIRESRLASIGKMDLDATNRGGHGYGRSDSGRFDTSPLSAAAKDMVERFFSPQEHTVLYEGGQEISATIQLKQKSLCFVDIVALRSRK